ncbi:starch synthase VI [Solanum lycopersicum]|uniref:Starch synthase, chloroplastic/amyloplastic n=1 Tax=Solanum lycopersicum TaxID=4081 RepID=B2ZGM9_SOLLC|nr:starch synthase VI [Solanum lycopersicum]ACD13790.1 starch synthase VI precursor [Solanum lycopersicum]
MDFTSCLSFPSSIAPNGNHSSSYNCSSSFNHRSCYNNISSKANLLKKQSYVFSKYQLRNFNIQLVPRIEAQLKAEQLEGSEAGCESDGLRWPSPSDEIPFWKGDFPSWDLSSDASSGVEQDSDLLHIVHVTAEMAPIAKVGGLGDVVTGLGRACLNRGHKVDVMIPFYECIPKHCINELALMRTYNSYHDGNWVACNAYRGEVSGVPVILIEPSNHFFKGKNIYGGSYNELDAYLFFSRACLEWMQVNGTQPDIIHVHEWQTGALPLFYWDMYHFLSLQKPRIVLTIHNMEHYGECRQEQLSKFGLDGSAYATEDKAVDDRTVGHNPERLSLLKGGIVYSNAIVTVSPTYLKETLCSGWLSGALMRNRDKYSGILNGIDTEMWNPATDIYLPAKFDAGKTEGKRICKKFVQKGLGLPISVADQKPLVVCITRLVAQKGLHLITHAIKHVEELGGQMVVLGRASDDRVEREFEGLAELHNKGSNIRILLMYSEELSHMLYAAADMVLVPSMYEPCGLAQMIGMRYGAVPIVRKTGGLADTVFDMDNQSHTEIANGFVFEGIDEGSLNCALGRAFSYYQEKPNEWKAVVQKVMRIDNSWNNTAGKYIDIYNSVRVR